MDNHLTVLQNLEIATEKLLSVQIENENLRKEVIGLRSFVQVSTNHHPADQNKVIFENILNDGEIYQQKKEKNIIPRIIHDLKNPLHNIKLSSELIKKCLEKSMGLEVDNKGRCQVWIQIITDSCDKTFAFLQDLITIEEIESDKFSMKKEIVSLRNYIANKLPLIKSQANHKNISVDFSFPEMDLYTALNVKYFGVALNNLISNAIKFTPPEGNITITLKQENENVLLQITDTGIGIPSEFENSIYHEFTTASRLGTEGEASKGMGLFITKKIILLHDGLLWAKSEEHKGTTFTIALNIAEPISS